MNLYTGTLPITTNSHGRAAESAPANLDPGTHPIIARHWFGVELLHPIGPATADVVADLAFGRSVTRLHGLGPRVVGELLAEIGAERGIQTFIDQKLERYAELQLKVLEAAGGDDFPSLPIHEVER